MGLVIPGDPGGLPLGLVIPGAYALLGEAVVLRHTPRIQAAHLVWVAWVVWVRRGAARGARWALRQRALRHGQARRVLHRRHLTGALLRVVLI